MNGHGNGLVARKLHGVVGATLGHAAQLGDVVEHFRERHERLDRLHATRLVAELVDGTTTRVQVTDNVTHGFFRGDDINLHDGLQKLRGALGDAFSERALGGDFESHDGGIDVVVRTIEQGGAQVHDRETGDDTRAHHLFQTARDARNVFLRHGATLDVGGELETGTRFERFKLDFNLGVLTGTTRLLLVRVLDFTRLGDRFTVVDLRRADVGFNLEFALEAIDDDVEVKLTHTFDDGLVGFFVTREVERRIFLRELDQTGGHLFDVSLGLRLDGNLDNGIGELHAFEDNLLSLVAQRVTGGGVLETSDGDDVTSARHFDVLTLVRVHLEEATDAFLLTLDGVVRVRAGFDDARVHADVDADDIYDDVLHNSKAAGSRSAANGSSAREGSGVEEDGGDIGPLLRVVKHDGDKRERKKSKSSTMPRPSLQGKEPGPYHRREPTYVEIDVTATGKENIALASSSSSSCEELSKSRSSHQLSVELSQGKVSPALSDTSMPPGSPATSSKSSKESWSTKKKKDKKKQKAEEKKKGKEKDRDKEKEKKKGKDKKGKSESSKKKKKKGQSNVAFADEGQEESSWRNSRGATPRFTHRIQPGEASETNVTREQREPLDLPEEHNREQTLWHAPNGLPPVDGGHQQHTSAAVPEGSSDNPSGCNTTPDASLSKEKSVDDSNDEDNRVANDESAGSSAGKVPVKPERSLSKEIYDIINNGFNSPALEKAAEVDTVEDGGLLESAVLLPPDVATTTKGLDSSNASPTPKPARITRQSVMASSPELLQCSFRSSSADSTSSGDRDSPTASLLGGRGRTWRGTRPTWTAPSAPRCPRPCTGRPAPAQSPPCTARPCPAASAPPCRRASSGPFGP